MNKAIIYTRVSTDEQARNGISLDDQEARCKKYADLYDLMVVGVVRDEGYSAGTLKRPGIDTIRHHLAEGVIDSVIIVRLDRLTRNVKDLWDMIEEFNQADVQLHGVDDRIDTASAAGRFFLNSMAGAAQFERDLTSERITSSLDHIRNTLGYHVGNAPYGWQLVPHEGPGSLLMPTISGIRTIKDARLRQDEGHSLRRIAIEMELSGPEAARRIIRSPLPPEMVYCAADMAGQKLYRWPVASDKAASDS